MCLFAVHRQDGSERLVKYTNQPHDRIRRVLRRNLVAVSAKLRREDVRNLLQPDVGAVDEVALAGRLADRHRLDVCGGDVPHVDDGDVDVRNQRHLSFEQPLRHQHAGRGDVARQDRAHHEARVNDRQLEALLRRQILNVLPRLHLRLQLALGIRRQVGGRRPVVLRHQLVPVVIEQRADGGDGAREDYPANGRGDTARLQDVQRALDGQIDRLVLVFVLVRERTRRVDDVGAAGGRGDPRRPVQQLGLDDL